VINVRVSGWIVLAVAARHATQAARSDPAHG
jgi:hypothetical protein